MKLTNMFNIISTLIDIFDRSIRSTLAHIEELTLSVILSI